MLSVFSNFRKRYKSYFPTKVILRYKGYELSRWDVLPCCTLLLSTQNPSYVHFFLFIKFYVIWNANLFLSHFLASWIYRKIIFFKRKMTLPSKIPISHKFIKTDTWCFVSSCQSVEGLMLILVVPSVLDALCFHTLLIWELNLLFIPVNLPMIYL